MSARRFACLITGVILILSAAQAAFKLPEPEKFVLKNGITVFYHKSSELPLISFRLFLRGAGSAQEPTALEGVANLTARLLTKGTARLDADAVAEAVDFMGASFAISASDEYASLSADGLAGNFPKLLEIAADCLTAPSFKEDEFEKERKTRLDSLKAVKDSPAAAVRNYFTKAYFGTHPLGHLTGGTEASLSKITLADVKSYYQKYYTPAKGLAAVVGDIDKATAEKLLNAAFGGWKGAGNIAASGLPALPKPAGVKLLLVDKPDATQAYWVMGAPGYALGAKITPEAAVMNTLFGGRFTSWLSTELRIKRGLTYGASSNVQTYRIGGVFSASSYTRNDKIGEMLAIALDLLKKARSEGFSAEEIESARNYIQGQFPPTLETNGAKANAYVRLTFFNLGFDYYDKYLAGVQAVTPAMAKSAAAQILPDRDYVLVVVGKAAEIKDQLSKFGTWTEKKITDPGF